MEDMKSKEEVISYFEKLKLEKEISINEKWKELKKYMLKARLITVLISSLILLLCYIFINKDFIIFNEIIFGIIMICFALCVSLKADEYFYELEKLKKLNYLRLENINIEHKQENASYKFEIIDKLKEKDKDTIYLLKFSGLYNTFKILKQSFLEEFGIENNVKNTDTYFLRLKLVYEDRTLIDIYEERYSMMKEHDFTELQETALIINEGITIAEKPLREHLEVVGHKEAYLYVVYLVKEKVSITEKVIKDIHNIVLMDKPQSRGVYRNLPIRVMGTENEVAQPYMIEPLMQDLIRSIDKIKISI